MSDKKNYSRRELLELSGKWAIGISGVVVGASLIAGCTGDDRGLEPDADLSDNGYY